VSFLHGVRDTVVRDQAGNLFARGTSKGGTFGKRCRAQPDCNNGIRNRNPKERYLLGSRRTLNKTSRQTVDLEVAK
jgi:hypothetical protein